MLIVLIKYQRIEKVKKEFQEVFVIYRFRGIKRKRYIFLKVYSFGVSFVGLVFRFVMMRYRMVIFERE